MNFLSLPDNKMHISYKIDPAFSVYLDIVRFLAAFSVFLGHSKQFHLYDGWIPLTNYSHSAVIIFFVLSGLVISATSARPKETPSRFVIARAARIYSVALPAIVLCYSMGILYGYFNNWHLDTSWRDSALSYSTPIQSVFFLLQSWHYAELPWNAPYWSLCYEVWYYVFFFILFFVSKKIKMLCLFLMMCLAGPAICTLFPVWWMGVWVMQHPKFSFGRRYANWIAFLASIAIIVTINELSIDTILRAFLHDEIPSYWRLNASQRFITDYIIGIAVAVNFLAIRNLSENISSWMRALSRPVKLLSAYTFSLYLYHYPLVRFFAVQFPNKKNYILQYIASMSLIFLFSIALGSITEKRRDFARLQIARLWRAFLPHPTADKGSESG